MKDRRRSCELCNNHATLYCAPDSAFLCFNCDSRLHGANFLVARHLRHPLCSQCNSLAEHPISGGHAVNIPNYTLCSPCSPENNSDENYDTLSISDSAYSSLSHPGSVKALISNATGPPITVQTLQLLPSLKLIATTSVDLAECRRR